MASPEMNRRSTRFPRKSRGRRISRRRSTPPAGSAARGRSSSASPSPTPASPSSCRQTGRCARRPPSPSARRRCSPCRFPPGRRPSTRRDRRARRWPPTGRWRRRRRSIRDGPRASIRPRRAARPPGPGAARARGPIPATIPDRIPVEGDRRERRGVAGALRRERDRPRGDGRIGRRAGAGHRGSGELPER